MDQTTWLKTTLLSTQCLFSYHIWSISNLNFALCPCSVSPIVPAAEFQSFQEQWEALTSEEQSNRCLSDKEVCRSHREHTDVRQHYLQTCFVSVFCLSGGSWNANHLPLPILCCGYEISFYLHCTLRGTCSDKNYDLSLKSCHQSNHQFSIFCLMFLNIHFSVYNDAQHESIGTAYFNSPFLSL